MGLGAGRGEQRACPGGVGHPGGRLVGGCQEVGYQQLQDLQDPASSTVQHLVEVRIVEGECKVKIRESSFFLFFQSHTLLCKKDCHFPNRTARIYFEPK